MTRSLECYIYFLQADELSFDEGDILYVYEKDVDSNWWKAKCGSREGLIPVNYGQNYFQ